jgi:hypothetical protein
MMLRAGNAGAFQGCLQSFSSRGFDGDIVLPAKTGSCISDVNHVLRSCDSVLPLAICAADVCKNAVGAI